MRQPTKVRKVDEERAIAEILFPELFFVSPGSFDDIQGIDAWLEEAPVQVKNDKTIVRTNNLYHEIYEKSALHPEQMWRKSPGSCRYYIFTTKTEMEFIGIKVAVDTLARLEMNQRLTPISPNNGHCTSMGFLIPVKAIPIGEREIRRKLINGRRI